MTDLFKINRNTVVVLDRVSTNNGNNWQYIANYQVDRKTIIPLFIKTPKNINSYGVSQNDSKSNYIMLFRVFEVTDKVLHY